MGAAGVHIQIGSFLSRMPVALSSSFPSPRLALRCSLLLLFVVLTRRTEQGGRLAGWLAGWLLDFVIRTCAPALCPPLLSPPRHHSPLPSYRNSDPPSPFATRKGGGGMGGWAGLGAQGAARSHVCALFSHVPPAGYRKQVNQNKTSAGWREQQSGSRGSSTHARMHAHASNQRAPSKHPARIIRYLSGSLVLRSQGILEGRSLASHFLLPLFFSLHTHTLTTKPYSSYTPSPTPQHPTTTKHVWTRKGRQRSRKGRCQATPQDPEGQHPGEHRAGRAFVVSSEPSLAP